MKFLAKPKVAGAAKPKSPKKKTAKKAGELIFKVIFQKISYWPTNFFSFIAGAKKPKSPKKTKSPKKAAKPKTAKPAKKAAPKKKPAAKKVAKKAAPAATA